MIATSDILKFPNRAVMLEYKFKDAKKRITKIVTTTEDPKMVKDKNDDLIDIETLMEESDEIYIIPIQ